MDNSEFLPVIVRHPRFRYSRHINSVDDAYDWLVHSRMKQETTAHSNARNACLYAMLHRGSAHWARDAFIEAAIEANIYVRERTL